MFPQSATRNAASTFTNFIRYSTAVNLSRLSSIEMAFAAVTSVLIAICDLGDSPRISLVSSALESLLCGFHQAQQLQTTLSCCSQVATASDEGIIIEEARTLEATIGFAVSTQFHEQHSKCCKPTFSLNLDHLKKDVDRFATVAEKMRRRIEELWEEKVAKMIEEDVVEICVPPQKEEEEYVSASATDMVGLCDEFNRWRDELTEPASFFEMFLWISGMAGVGKTTFVERIYHDPSVKASFKCRAFVRVGREYRMERVLRAITTQLNHGDEKMMKEGDNMDPYDYFFKTLSLKRCLIVLDDVWDTNMFVNLAERIKSFVNRRGWIFDDAWNSNIFNRAERIKSLVKRGSWILSISRMEPYFHFAPLRLLKLRFLNEEESWELLKRKVFDEKQQVCPPLLVKPGKKIAKKCEGLPLLIIAVAEVLLSKVPKNKESWKRVAEKPNSVLEEACHRISEILITSYYAIEERYKLCFLYLAAFPQSYVIFSSMIMDLWYAEGFSDFCTYSDALRELRRNNLVITDGHTSWSSYNIKACSLHCAYWYLCKRVAKDNRFLYIMNSYADGTDERVKSHNRLAIQTNVLLAIKEVGDMIASIPTVRSLLCTGPYHQYQVPICSHEWKVLRVLDALSIRFYEFPVEVVNLTLLRYLSLTCNANLPPSISKLWSLQFLIVHQHSRIRRVAGDDHECYYVPVEIWELQELIHLEIPGRNLPHPPHPGVVFPNLEKLLDVGLESCIKGVLDNIPKLKKLRIQTELAPEAAEIPLICFYNMESFQYVVMNPTLLRPSPLLPNPISGLKKLSLSGCGYPWEEMSKIGRLPNLKVLKLRCYAFRGEKWEANEEMRFSNLQYLYIEDTDLVQWSVTGKNTMPRLLCLTMKYCHKLLDIPRFSFPRGFIELVDCNPLAETRANLPYKSVTASYSWKHKSA